MPEAWWRRPLRVIQTPMSADAVASGVPALVRSLRDLGADVVAVDAADVCDWDSAGGEGDSSPDGRLNAACEAAHEMGMKLALLVDVSRAPAALRERHPRWLAVGADGAPVHAPAGGDDLPMVATCPLALGPDDGSGFPVLDVLASSAAVDAVALRLTEPAACFCDRCRARYADSVGSPMPLDFEDWSPEWPDAVTQAGLRQFRSAVQNLRPDLPCLMPYDLTGGFRPEAGEDDSASPPASPDVQPPSDDEASHANDAAGVGWLAQPGAPFGEGLPPRWWPAVHAGLGRWRAHGAPPWMAMPGGAGGPHPLAGMPSFDHRFALAQAVAGGASVWHVLNEPPGRQPDPRPARAVKALNEQVAFLARWLDGAQPVCQFGVLLSRRSLLGPNGARCRAELYGFLEACYNHQILTTLLPEEEITAEGLRSLQAIILPDVEALSSAAARLVRDFAADGGGVLASYATGCGDPASSLDDLFGIERHSTADPVRAPYLQPQESAGPMAANLADARLLPFDADALPVSLVDGAVPLLSLDSGRGDAPAWPAAVRKGNAVYFACPIGRLVWQHRLPDHQDLIAGALRLASPEPPLIEIENGHGIQAFLYRQPARFVLHLVNGVGERPLQDLTRFKDLVLRVRLPAGCILKDIRWVTKQVALGYHKLAGTHVVRIPEAATWEVLGLNLELGPPPAAS